MSNLVNHAKKELQIIGMYGGNGTEGSYNELVADAVMELVEKFAAQGHSGMSAAMTIDIFKTLASFKPLSPITNSPEEWVEVGPAVWQNTRRSSSFSRDGGKTWYDIDNPNFNNGDVWKHRRWLWRK